MLGFLPINLKDFNFFCVCCSHVTHLNVGINAWCGWVAWFFD